LAKLLSPVVLHEDQLRSALVLVRLDLRPRVKSALGSWKEVCKKSRDLLERCVYLDKDLVLPPMNMPGPEQSFFVVASTDLERSAIMLKRIQEQLQKLEELKTSGTFELSVAAIPLPDASDGISLYLQVQEVADRVTEMARDAVGSMKGQNQQPLSN
jgi:hypothetical protein